MDSPRLSINLRSAPVWGGLAGDRPISFSGERYSAFLTPADADAHWIKAGPSRHLNIYFDETLAEEFAVDGRAPRDCRTPLLGADLRRHRVLIDALQRACTLPASCAEDASLGLAYLILAEVLLEPRRAPTIGAAQVRRLREYISEHLAHPVRVADLAVVLGMSPPQFTLAFRNSLGCTPQRFLMRQRLATAIRLLRNTRHPISEVAMSCGFCSQQHLTTAMREHTGRTPGQLR